MGMNKRLDEIDTLRGLSALSVILIHVSGFYVAFSSIGFYSNQIVRFAVPIFILLSGFSLYYSDSTRKPDAYASFILKRLQKIFMPYLLWSSVYLLLRILEGGKTHTLKEIGTILLHGQASYHLYFIIIIMQLYLIYPLLRKAVQRFGRWTLVISFLITLYYQTGIYLRAVKLDILPIKRILFENYMVLFTWVFFFVLGMMLAKHFDRFLAWADHKVIPAVLWVLSAALLILDSRLTKTHELSIRPSVMLYSVISFLFLYQICRWLKKHLPMIEKTLLWISGQSFFIYFCHALVLSRLIKYLQKGPLCFIFARGAGMPVLFLLTTGLTCLLAYLLSFLPLSQYLGCRRSVRIKPTITPEARAKAR